MANNIAATLGRREPQPFQFRAIGALVALRQRIAAGETLFWGLAYGPFW